MPALTGQGTSGLWSPGLRLGQVGNPGAEFHELAMDALHTPEAVLPGHLLDQSDGFVRYPGAPTPVAGLEPPK